jgi:trans-aconitate methyltransferase
MAKTWKEVWASRRLDPARASTMSRLLAADGWDTGFGNVEEAAWQRYVERTARAIGMTPGSRVFEVGCGAGAYLFALHEAGCEVAGLDPSAALLTYARDAIPHGRFVLAEAADLDPLAQYDFVVSSGVFLYFPCLDYARNVLERMVRKARRGVMVLDVPDLAKRDDALELRRAWAGDRAYAQKYQGLDHLYYDRAWFEAVLAAAGVTRMRIDDQEIDGYANAVHRYNVLAWPSGT